ncbi:MAG: glycosyltransferase family A protein [Muribaculaceae bacterium]
METKISIVIPVRNRADSVCRTLDSIAAQVYRPLRVIVVDNGSTDGSTDTVQHWASQHCDNNLSLTLLSEAQPGACAARNRGLEAVDTPWTMFFDSDDTMRPRHIERAMAVAEAHPDADIIGWDVLHHCGSVETRKRFIIKDIVYNNLMHSSFATLRYMARTDLFRRAGGWLLGARLFDDVELGMRLLALKPTVVYAGTDITVDVFESEQSISTASRADISHMDIAVDAIERTLPLNHRHWVDLRRLIFLAGEGAGDPAAHQRATTIIAATPLPRRLLWQLLYKYSHAGGRGVARIYRLFTALKI